MKRPGHLRLVPSEAQAAMPAQPRAPAPPEPRQRRKLPPLRPARSSASIRKSLRDLAAAHAAAINQCIASVDSDAAGAVDKLEQLQRTMATQSKALRESLRRDHNGQRWKKGMSYDEN